MDGWKTIDGGEEGSTVGKEGNDARECVFLGEGGQMGPFGTWHRPLLLILPVHFF